MAVDDLLRVARRGAASGWARRGGSREAMLTLAVAEGGPGSGWAERCRARLLAERPKHFLGTHPSLERTLADPEVAEAIRKLRGQYPDGRVGWLRFRSEVESGPFTGDVAPLETIVDALAGPPAEAEVRRDAAQAVRGPLARARAEVVVGATPAGPRRADRRASPRGIPPPGDAPSPRGRRDDLVALSRRSCWRSRCCWRASRRGGRVERPDRSSGGDDVTPNLSLERTSATIWLCSALSTGGQSPAPWSSVKPFMTKR